MWLTNAVIGNKVIGLPRSGVSQGFPNSLETIKRKRTQSSCYVHATTNTYGFTLTHVTLFLEAFSPNNKSKDNHA